MYELGVLVLLHSTCMISTPRLSHYKVPETLKSVQKPAKTS